MEITAQLDVEALLDAVASRAVELLEGTGGGFFAHRPERDVLEWSIGHGSSLPPIGSILLRGEGLAGKVWVGGEPLIVNDYWHWEGRTARHETSRGMSPPLGDDCSSPVTAIVRVG